MLGAIAKLPSSVDLRRDQGFGFVKPAYIKAACYPESYGAVD